MNKKNFCWKDIVLFAVVSLAVIAVLSVLYFLW